ncbi:hypothetical protein SPLC1_S170530 [Arthrospira platensis C1]|nr:hypothetical protein SPLC1_S170530 [Arthrospira platensis C1]
MGVIENLSQDTEIQYVAIALPNPDCDLKSNMNKC